MLTNIFTLVVAVMNLSLGVFVFVRNPRKALYISFLVLSAVNSFWVFSYLFYDSSPLLVLKSQYAIGALVLPAGLIWLDFLSHETANIWRRLIVSGTGAFWFLIAFTDGFMIESVDVSTREYVAGPFYIFYGLTIVALFMYMLFFIISRVRKSFGLKKAQLTYVLLGILGFGLVSMFDVVSPLFNIKIVDPISSQSTLIFVGFAAATIIKHKFMDIRMIVARSFAYVILIAVFSLSYASGILLLERLFLGSSSLAINTSAGLIRIFLAILLAVGFHPLKVRITKITEKIFFKNTYKPQEVYKRLSTLMSSATGIEEVILEVKDLLGRELKPTNLFFITIWNGRMKKRKDLSPESALDIDVEEIKKLNESQILFVDEIDDENSIVKTILDKYQVAVSIPLKTTTEQVGVILLGAKSSGEIYTPRDLDLFEAMAPEIAINISLRLKVSETIEKREDANRKLRELDKTKDDFMSIVAHNLRTPLTIIKGYASFLSDKRKQIRLEGFAENIDGINLGVERLSVLVENIVLSVSILNKQQSLMLEKMDTKELVSGVLANQEKKIKEKNLSVKLLQEKVDFFADKNLLAQVFNNLIENAVKFSNERGVITIESKIDEEKKNMIFSVKDTGIGIPKDQQEGIFEKFDRKTDIMNYQYEGVGLGLYLARLIVFAHKGKLWFESKEGEGSTFYFSLPM